MFNNGIKGICLCFFVFITHHITIIAQLPPKLVWHSPSIGSESRFCGVNKSLLLTTYSQYSTVWDAATGNLIRNLVDEEGNLYKVLASDSESELAVIAPKKGKCFVMNLRTGTKLTLLLSYDPAINYESDEYIKFVVLNSTKAEVLVSYHNRVEIWDYEKGIIVNKIQPIQYASAIVLNNQGTHAVITHYNEKWVASLWDMRTFTKITEFDVPNVYAVAEFSDDGTLFFMRYYGKNQIVRKTENGGIVNMFPHNYDITASVFLHSAKHLATISRTNNIIKVWDIYSGKLIKEVPGLGDGINFSNDDKYVLIAAHHGSGGYILGTKLTYIEVESGKQIFQQYYDGGYYGIYTSGRCYDEKLHRVLVSNTSKVENIDLTKKNTTLTFYRSILFKYANKAIICSGEGTIAISNADSSLFLVNGENGTVTRALSEKKYVAVELTYNDKRDILLTKGNDKVARLWKVSTGEQMVAIDGYGKGVISALWDNYNNRIITLDADTAVRVWSSSNGTLQTILKRQKTEQKAIKNVLQSNNGEIVLTVGDRDVDIWNVISANFSATVTPEGKLIEVVSPENGNSFFTLARGANDVTIITEWESQTGVMIQKTTLDLRYNNLLVNKKLDRIVLERDGGYLYLMSLPTFETLTITEGTLTNKKAYFDNSGNVFVSLTDRGTVNIHIAKTGEWINTLNSEVVVLTSIDTKGNLITVNNNGDLKEWKTEISIEEEKLQSQFLFFPNPASDVVKIKTDIVKEKTLYTVSNIIGEAVLNDYLYPGTSDFEVGISSLPIGRYIFSTVINNNRINEEFIVMR